MMRYFTMLAAAAMLLSITRPAVAQPAAKSQPKFLHKTAAEWAGQLKDPSARQRRSAAFALGKLGLYASAAVPELRKHYRLETDAGAREAIVAALGEIAEDMGSGDAELEKLLIEAVQRDPDRLVRRSAAGALGQMGSKSDAVREALAQAIADSEQVVRQGAAWSLGQFDAKAAPILVAALKDDSSDALVKRDAANSLFAVSLGDPALVRPAVSDLLAMCRHTDPEVRKAGLKPLIRALNSTDKGAIPTLTAALRDPDLEVRRFAALALSKVGGAGAAAAVPVLVSELHHPEAEVRKAAFLAICKLGKDGAAAVPALIKILEDSDNENAKNAALALGGMGPAAAAAVPALLKVLRNSALPADVRVDAGEALVRVGDVPAVRQRMGDILETLGNSSEDGKVRVRVAWLFNAFAGDRAVMGQASPVMTKICGETMTKQNGEALFHCAYLLGIVKQREIPEPALNVLAAVLHDDGYKLYKNKQVAFDASGAEVKGKTSVDLELVGDARTMVVEVLGLLDRNRVIARNDIVNQLRVLAADGKTFPELRTKTKELLKTLGK